MARKLKSGKWQADISDERRGVQRTRRNFDTRKEAQAYEAAVRSEATDNLLGRRKRRLFGEALNRYLTEISPAKKNHEGDIRVARMLRYPFWHEGKWIWLEHAPLEAPPGQLSIAQAINAYCADLHGVIRRAYLNGKTYHLRKTNGPAVWYEQPGSEDGKPPRPRILVTDAAACEALNKSQGRGPYKPETLRIRQALVRSVLKACWRKWDWIGRELGSKIALESKSPGRQHHLTPAELEALIDAAKGSEYGDHLAHAIEAAAIIGWRRSNLLGMTWAQVIFPVFDAEGLELQMGLITCAGEEVKNGQDLAQPMSNRLYDLLARRWNLRNGQHVFHQGNGKPFGDFRKAWASLLKTVGITPDFRWHDLRHTWASHLLQAGATPRQLQELGGWKSQAMPNHYAHLRVEHLRAAVELTRRPSEEKP